MTNKFLKNSIKKLRKRWCKQLKTTKVLSQIEVLKPIGKEIPSYIAETYKNDAERYVCEGLINEMMRNNLITLTVDENDKTMVFKAVCRVCIPHK